MIVYVLVNNEAHEGGSVAGVFSSERKAREELARRGPASPPFFWEIIPVELDASSRPLDSIGRE